MTCPSPCIERSRRGSAALAAVVAGAAVLVAAPSEACADTSKFLRTLDISFHHRVGTFRPEGRPLREIGTHPTPLAGARLAGTATSVAPLLRANLSLHGLRVGVGMGFEGYRGLRLDHAPSAYGVTDGRVGGLPLEAFAGYALRPDKRIRPFVEARTTGTLVLARARLHHRDDGDLGQIQMRAATLAVGVRAGVILALGRDFFLDAGVGRVVHGPGRWTASLGIGIPIPLDNL